jgi:thiamine monophosphate synthase
MRLMAITDAAFGEAAMFRTAMDLAERYGTQFCVQIRTGFSSPAHVRKLAERCIQTGAQLYFNRDALSAIQNKVGFHGDASSVEAARAAGFQGPCSMPVHSASELMRAAELCVQTVLISPVFAVPGKGNPLGPDGLDALLKQASPETHVYALGGINTQTLAPLLGLKNLAGIACIRAVWTEGSTLVQLLEQNPSQ